MADELYRSQDDTLALSGETGGGGIKYATTNENPYSESGLRAQSRLSDAMIPLTAFEVYKTGDLTYGVRAGQFVNVDAVVSYTATTENALTNNKTNYIYIIRDGTLTVSTTAFPTPGVTPHLPLAEIVVAAGVYAITDITDRRPRSIFQIVGIQAWHDLRVPLTALNTGGANAPSFASWLDNGAGSQGINAWFFDDAAEKELYFAAQVPHDYREGTDLEAHIHWAPAANGGAGEVVSWGLEYVIKSISGTFGNTTIIDGNTHFPADASLVDDKHYRTAIGTISGTGITISAMLIGRIFRDATGALGTDDLAQDAIGFELDFHYQCDSMGSANRDAK